MKILSITALACLLPALSVPALAQESWYTGEKPPVFSPYPVMPRTATNAFNASATLSSPEPAAAPAPAPAPALVPEPPASQSAPAQQPAPPPAPPIEQKPDASGPSESFPSDANAGDGAADLSRDSDFLRWLRELEREAVARGVSPVTARTALQNRALDERVVELDQKQPEKTATFESYQARIVSADRIAKGRRLYAEHASLLKNIAESYGVPAPVIVALWGIESAFGRNIGNYDVLNSLTTLAYEGRRANFFRKELIETLLLLDEERRPASSLIGSWAGAMGQCQFMPSTFRRYAVDYNRDGMRDIWNDTADVFASIANYLAAEGWRSGLAWGREVDTETVPGDARVGLDSPKPLSEWRRLGVRSLDGTELPVRNVSASLIQPDGSDGRSFLVYDNYRAVMRWNRSTYFATAVGLLADRIAQ